MRWGRLGLISGKREKFARFVIRDRYIKRFVSFVFFLGLASSHFGWPKEDNARTRSISRNSPDVAGRQWSFDVVSIKLSSEQDILNGIEGPGVNEYISIGQPLAIVILRAYLPTGMISRERLIGAPSWVTSTNYSIRGKVSETDMSAWSAERNHSNPFTSPAILQSMLQNALSDRCHLVIHRVPSTMRGFALVVDSTSRSSRALKLSNHSKRDFGKAVDLTDGGMMFPITSSEDPELRFFHTSMKSLAAQLSMFGALVEDRTGIEGKFDFELTRLGFDEYLPSN